MRNTGSEFLSESILESLMPPQNHVLAADQRQRASTLTFECTAPTPRVPVPSLSLIEHSPHFVLLIRIGLWAAAAILWRQLDAMHSTTHDKPSLYHLGNDEPGACRELNKQSFLPQSL